MVFYGGRHSKRRQPTLPVCLEPLPRQEIKQIFG